MYDEPRERRDDPDIALAKVRIGRILQQQSVASIRTLESKISESGRGPKPAPHSIHNALYQLVRETDGALESEPLVVRSDRPKLPCEMFYLSAADPKTVAQVLAEKIRVEKIWHRFASRTGYETIGQLRERIVRQAPSKRRRTCCTLHPDGAMSNA